METKYIPLTKGRRAIIDAEDYDELSKYKWRVDSGGYAVRTAHMGVDRGVPVKKQLRMHRFVAKAKPDEIIDHVNCNKLDNRKSNLRTVDKTASNINQPRVFSNSGFRGVSICPWDKSKFIARIKVNKKEKHLGVYDKAEEAALVYDEAAIKHHKEYAMTNKRLGLL